MVGTNKRPAAPATAAPPLPPGPQPTPEQQAQINAAWSQYYVSPQRPKLVTAKHELK